MSVEIYNSESSFSVLVDDTANYPISYSENIKCPDHSRLAYLTNADAAHLKFSDIQMAERLSSLTSFISSFNSSSPINVDSGILPPGLLYLTKNYLVFERPPTYQNIFLIPRLVSDIGNNTESVLYRLPIPWQLYFVQYTDTGDQCYTANVAMHFMNGPLLSVDQNVYMAPLTNLYSSGLLCRPMYSSMEDIDRYSKDISGVMHSAYDWIWNSGTNVDLTSSVVQSIYQFKDNIENTILKNLENPTLYTRHCNIDSHYCSSNHVEALYSSWEKFNIEDLPSLTWANNSVNPHFFSDYSQARENLYNQYIVDNNIVSHSDCCEDCLYYDDDTQETENREDCDCACHPSSFGNLIDFYKYANLLPVPSRTYAHCFANFIKATKPDKQFYSPFSYRSIVDSILLPSLS